MAVLGCTIFRNSTDSSSHMHVPKTLDRFTGHWVRGGGDGGISPEGRRHQKIYSLKCQYHTLLLDLNYPNVLPSCKLSGEVTCADCSQLATERATRKTHTAITSYHIYEVRIVATYNIVYPHYFCGT